MKILILLAFSTFAVTALYQIHLTRFESAKTKMIKAGIWKDYIIKKDVIRSTAHKINKKYTQNVTDYEDVEYYGNITIGTPGQFFIVSVDTAFAFLWVPDVTCEDEIEPDQYLQYGPRSKSANGENAEKNSLISFPTGCKGKNKFNQTTSSTYVYNGTEWQTPFESILNMRWAYGIFGEDTVRFGESETKSLTVPNVTFGQAIITASALSEVAFDGILGLAFPTLTVYDVASPFFEAVNQGLVDKPVFTVFLLHRGYTQEEYGGVFTYGGFDNVNCESVLAYENLTSATYYQFKLESVKYGLYSSRKGWQAILDTGNAFIWTPYWVLHSIVKEAKAKYDFTFYCYTVDCEAQLGDIELGIGAETYRIGRKNYIVEKLPGVCCLEITYNSGTGFAPEWNLGYPFLRSYCTIYDVEQKRIGFAYPKTK